MSERVVEIVDRLTDVLAIHSFAAEAMYTLAQQGVPPKVARGYQLVSTNIETVIEESISDLKIVGGVR